MHLLLFVDYLGAFTFTIENFFYTIDYKLLPVLDEVFFMTKHEFHWKYPWNEVHNVYLTFKIILNMCWCNNIKNTFVMWLTFEMSNRPW